MGKSRQFEEPSADLAESVIAPPLNHSPFAVAQPGQIGVAEREIHRFPPSSLPLR